MEIIITAASILGVTGLFWLGDRLIKLGICPICAGVSITWFWMLAGIYFNYLPTAIYQPLAAILIGGSVVGIAYKIGERMPADKSILLWKTLFIPAGFIAAYGIITFSRLTFVIATIVIGMLYLTFAARKTSLSESKKSRVEELEQKMKNCC